MVHAGQAVPDCHTLGVLLEDELLLVIMGDEWAGPYPHPLCRKLKPTRQI